MAFTYVPNPAIEAEILTDATVHVAIMEVGAEVLAFAQDHAPVETGALRRSLDLESEGSGARVSVNVDYWAFPEYGTSRMDAQPYLRPALTACGLHVT